MDKLENICYNTHNLVDARFFAQGVNMKLQKYAGNPILKPNPENQWEERCVLNPAVIYDDKNEEFVMLYRAAGNDVRHQIKLGLATSKDGIHFVRQSDKPAFEAGHCE